MPTLFERFKTLKELSGLNLVEFSAKIGLPENTMRTMWKRSTAPKGDVLSRCCVEWPQYAMWLMTGNQDYLPINSSYKEMYRIVDLVKASNISESIITPSCFKQLLLIQSEDNENELAAIITLKTHLPYLKCLVITSGELNLCSRFKGKQLLDEFRIWLCAISPSLVQQAKILVCKQFVIDEINNGQSILHCHLKDACPGEHDFFIDSLSQWKQS